MEANPYEQISIYILTEEHFPVYTIHKHFPEEYEREKLISKDVFLRIEKAAIEFRKCQKIMRNLYK